MKRNRRSNRRARGFTIVEIMVVVIIIAVLGAMIVPRFFGRIGTSKQSVAASNLVEIEKAIDMFAYEYGRMPQTLDELVNRPSDISEDKWSQPTLKQKDLLDPWERPFLYKQPGDHGAYDLYSLGADNAVGGEKENADVTNW